MAYCYIRPYSDRLSTRTSGTKSWSTRHWRADITRSGAISTEKSAVITALKIFRKLKTVIIIITSWYNLEINYFLTIFFTQKIIQRVLMSETDICTWCSETISQADKDAMQKVLDAKNASKIQPCCILWQTAFGRIQKKKIWIQNRHVTRKKRGVKAPRAAARGVNIWSRN